MSIITRRTVTPTYRTNATPERTLRALLGWDPFAEMTPYAQKDASFAPSFDVKESAEGYVFVADLPGVAEKDLDISLDGRRLTVSGKRESEEHQESDVHFAYERTFGSFTRSFTLPESANADDVKAELKNGVLTLILAKKPENQPRKISLSGLAQKNKA
jgi:HSP20 family protein